jgi:hypothetical protein
MEQERLSHLESLIARRQEHFYEIGKALKEIRDNRLYKLALFETFAAYARARWDMSRSHAHRLIDAYGVIRNLSPIGDILPANEAQVRPLAKLNPSQQQNIWRRFLESGLELTALNLKKFIDGAGPEKKKTDLTERVSREYMTAVRSMMEQVRVAQHDNWQKTSRQAALLWNRVIREKILSKGADNGRIDT